MLSDVREDSDAWERDKDSGTYNLTQYGYEKSERWNMRKEMGMSVREGAAVEWNENWDVKEEDKTPKVVVDGRELWPWEREAFANSDVPMRLRYRKREDVPEEVKTALGIQ